ncbi:hypothetical protein ACFWR9_27695 [Streptomyces sp. NPDC058534]
MDRPPGWAWDGVVPGLWMSGHEFVAYLRAGPATARLLEDPAE